MRVFLHRSCRWVRLAIEVEEVKGHHHLHELHILAIEGEEVKGHHLAIEVEEVKRHHGQGHQEKGHQEQGYQKQGHHQLHFASSNAWHFL
jgi:hypothetical protein